MVSAGAVKVNCSNINGNFKLNGLVLVKFSSPSQVMLTLCAWYISTRPSNAEREKEYKALELFLFDFCLCLYPVIPFRADLDHLGRNTS